ncbi:MAG: HIT domain-containing protein [Marinovum algicola]|uniref:HIT family protein n=1 Tax=Marinovum algicola TaxID=42444 RepID=UPI0032ED5CDD
MTEMHHLDRQASTESKFHWLFLNGEKPSAELYDTIIDETANFAVLPTKGSIVPGWVLIVPKFPVSRIADVPETLSVELSTLVRRVVEKVQAEFGKTFAFEHGGYKGSKISCGVDQAHLHVVPLPFDLVDAAETASPGSWNSFGSTLIPNGDMPDDEYWFVSDGNLSKYKALSEPSSQFFRKVIACGVGSKDSWDYRQADFIENVKVTLKTVGANG